MAIVLGARTEIQNERERKRARAILASYSSPAEQSNSNNNYYPSISTVSYPTHSSAYGHVNENFYNSEDFASKLM